MLFRSAAHPGRAVRLAYCMNLHAAETLDELIANMQRITLPLRERLAPGAEFGVGMYLPAKLARELASDAAQLARLKRFLDEHALDPFTYNAFPYGGFQTDGLKERVFEPTWWEPARREFTLDVARVASALVTDRASGRHISISTHTGAYQRSVRPDELEKRQRQCVAEWTSFCEQLSRLESEGGMPTVLSLEHEPGALFGSISVIGWHVDGLVVPSRELERHRLPNRLQRHLAVCLDTCHQAIEFEDSRFAAQSACAALGGLGKLQFSSALVLIDPSRNERGRAALLALAEPRFLHQVHGQAPHAVVFASDLPELAKAWQDSRSAWHRCDELRCHFHVPVDVGEFAESGLATTRDFADRVLDGALGIATEWRRPELQVEIETYTWDVLPRAARGAGELVDGLEREYRHVLGVLENAGWKHAAS